MLKKMIAVSGLLLIVAGVLLLGVPSEASAGWIIWGKSIHCDVTVAAQGTPTIDDTMLCLAKLKVIQAFCSNPADGSAAPNNGQPFNIEAVVSATSTANWTFPEPGKAAQDIVITNKKIQEALDVYNAQNGKPFVFLKSTTALCKKGWNFLGWFVSRVDGQLIDVKVPSLTDGPGGPVIASGWADFTYETEDGARPLQCPAATTDPTPVQLTTHCKCIPIPRWNWTWDAAEENGISGDGSWDGTTYTYAKVCGFRGQPFKYCSRFPSAMDKAGNVADSGLRIYDWNGNPLPNPDGVSDGTYKTKNCLLWRDVNKDPAFDLSVIGGQNYTYDPDVAHIIPPQTGNPQQKVKGQLTSVSDATLGGWVLRNVHVTDPNDPNDHNIYTGECHQHGDESNMSSNSGYRWKQKGPQKHTDTQAGDDFCPGGSQDLDGTYDAGVLP